MNRVAIFGGGMGGLCAAHELIERGFAVDIYETRRIWGGKARSYGVHGTGTPGHHDLPGEHGFRFFPGFYKHIPDTMSRIPFPNVDSAGRVSDNLVQCLAGQILQDGKAPTTFPVRFPQSWAELRQRVSDLRHRGPLGFRAGELRHFLGRMLRIAVSCQDRRMAVYEKVTWWDFVGAEQRSDAYKKLLARGLTRSLVAMRAEVASTRTVGDIMLQMVYSLLTPGASSDRLLSGPTSMVWIDPWRAYLASRGVRFHDGSTLEGFELGDGNRIAAARLRHADGTSATVQADHYVAAVPCEVMDRIIDAALERAAPALQNIRQLHVAWMNGVQFYLSRDVPMAYGHSIFSDASWALTAVSQPQFWRNGPFAIDRFGDGTVKGLMSVDISAWTEKGQFTTGKWASHCTREQIIDEVWAQLKSHWLDAKGQHLEDSDRLGAHLDHDIECVKADTPATRAGELASRRGVLRVHRINQVRDIDTEPLLINTKDSWKNRPDARTDIPNLFLAADYVRTHTDLATMEGANEAARRAVNAILAATGSPEKPCAVWPLREPLLLAPLRAIDWLLFRFQKPKSGSAPTA